VARKNKQKKREDIQEEKKLEEAVDAAEVQDGEDEEGEPQAQPEGADSEKDPAAELAQAIAERDECKDKMLRMAADLENFKKRMIRERDNTLKYAEENLIRDLLPTIDNLGRALDHEPDGDIASFMEGVDMTMKGLLTTLEKAGLTPIESVGEPFDPNIHEAMVMENSDEVADQHVIREFEKGYYYKDRLIRAAKVVVSKGN